MKFVYTLIIFFVLVVVQLTIIPFFSISYFRPDLISILVSVFAIRFGSIMGMSNGFVLGLLFDLISGGIIGLSSFSKTVNGFIAGQFSREKREEESVNFMKVILIILLCSSLDNFFYTYLSGSSLNVNVFEILLLYGLMPGLYTSLLALPLFLIKERI
ncbi:MAG: rod shape-determining protein MreD [Melioribacteraceae bacterium]|nr:rod shape-determining protein MreD [Melioribacteraceae bacterium]